ncbi:MAG: tyrosine-type recombinase/integrase [Treponema sp.]|nr:tyrosine-type recombinase/integrase [Treponema sp.]
MMRPFYLHRRSGVWYAQLTDSETGRILTARSTGTQSRDEAILIVAEWRKNGIPSGRQRKPKPIALAADVESILRAVRKADLFSEDALRIVQTLKDRGLIDVAATKSGPGSVQLSEFLETFWDYHASPYVKEKLAHKQSITKRHCYEMGSRVRKYWLPAFNDRTLNSITRQDLKDFSLSLAEKGLAPASINKIMLGGNVALSWAHREGHIAVDPTEKLMRFSGVPEKRGILTPAEAETIFHKVNWRDKRAYIGNLLAITTGLRCGEILAVRKNDIGEKILTVDHSWSSFDKLKTTKTNESRRVPLLPEVREKLLELLAENPHDTENSYVFYGLYENQPVDNKVLLKGLREACTAVGIDYKARGICFHSHRHYYAARMADRMEADKISRITGHRSKAIFDHYADHIIDENLDEVGKVGAEVFGNILQFRKGA